MQIREVADDLKAASEDTTLEAADLAIEMEADLAIEMEAAERRLRQIADELDAAQASKKEGHG